MTYYEKYLELSKNNDPYPLTGNFIDYASETFKVITEIMKKKCKTPSDEKNMLVFENCCKEFMGIVQIWHKYGAKSEVAKPELQKVEQTLQNSPNLMEYFQINLDGLKSDGNDDDDKSGKTGDAVEKIKDLIPDKIWGIDITWLKKLIDNLLKLFL